MKMEEAAPPNYGKYLPFNKALHLRRYESSAVLIFQPELQCVILALQVLQR
jgi:hypothetical protein